MTPIRQRQFEPSAAAVMAFPAPSGWARFEDTVLNTRVSLMIIGYELALRVLILARRWNY
ncbi:MAG: hypothetical protein WAK91_11300 [Candidatus Acidiferrales bacterium]|jgi:hypothetical protein